MSSSDQSRDLITSNQSFRRFANVLAAPGNAQATKKILFLATPRSGSTLFCQKLSADGRIGQPEEWLSPKVINDFNKISEIKIKNILSWWNSVKSTAVSSDGVFSCKLMVRQYAHWKHLGFDVLAEHWDHVVWIKRRRIIQQAVSLAKARKTDNWTDTNSNAVKSEFLNISKAQILRALSEIVSWDEYFNSNLKPFVHKTFIYEDFSQHNGTYSDFRKELGIFGDFDPNEMLKLRKQRTEKDEERANIFADWIRQISIEQRSGT